MAVTDIYPTPNGTIWGFDSYITYIVSVEPLFFVVLLGVLWIIALVATKQYGMPRSFTFASLMTFVLSAPIVLMGWLDNRYMYLALLMTAVGLIWIRFNDSYY